MLVLRRERPLLFEAGEEGTVAELERLVETSLPSETIRLEDVDPRVGGEADAIAGGDERLVAERTAQGPEGTPQARTSAFVEDVGPEDRGCGRSRLGAGTQPEPRQQ